MHEEGRVRWRISQILLAPLLLTTTRTNASILDFNSIKDAFMRNTMKELNQKANHSSAFIQQIHQDAVMIEPSSFVAASITDDTQHLNFDVSRIFTREQTTDESQQSSVFARKHKGNSKKQKAADYLLSQFYLSPSGKGSSSKTKKKKKSTKKLKGSKKKSLKSKMGKGKKNSSKYSIVTIPSPTPTIAETKSLMPSMSLSPSPSYHYNSMSKKSKKSKSKKKKKSSKSKSKKKSKKQSKSKKKSKNTVQPTTATTSNMVSGDPSTVVPTTFTSSIISTIPGSDLPSDVPSEQVASSRPPSAVSTTADTPTATSLPSDIPSLQASRPPSSVSTPQSTPSATLAATDTTLAATDTTLTPTTIGTTPGTPLSTTAVTTLDTTGVTSDGPSLSPSTSSTTNSATTTTTTSNTVLPTTSGTNLASDGPSLSPSRPLSSIATVSGSQPTSTTLVPTISASTISPASNLLSNVPSIFRSDLPSLRSYIPSSDASSSFTDVSTQGFSTLNITGADAVVVPFSIVYETADDSTATVPSMIHIAEVTEITLNFLDDYLEKNSSLDQEAQYDTLTGYSERNATHPGFIFYEVTLYFEPTSTEIPTRDDILKTLSTAFQKPEVQTYLLMLSILNKSNPFSTTTRVTFHGDEITQKSDSVTPNTVSNSSRSLAIIAGVFVCTFATSYFLLTNFYNNKDAKSSGLLSCVKKNQQHRQHADKMIPVYSPRAEPHEKLLEDDIAQKQQTAMETLSYSSSSVEPPSVKWPYIFARYNDTQSSSQDEREVMSIIFQHDDETADGSKHHQDPLIPQGSNYSLFNAPSTSESEMEEGSEEDPLMIKYPLTSKAGGGSESLFDAPFTSSELEDEIEQEDTLMASSVHKFYLYWKP